MGLTRHLADRLQQPLTILLRQQAHAYLHQFGDQGLFGDHLRPLRSQFPAQGNNLGPIIASCFS